MKNEKLKSVFLIITCVLYLLFLLYGIDLYFNNENPIIIILMYTTGIITQLIVYRYVEFLYNKDKKYIKDYNYYKEINFNEIKPIEAGILINEKNANLNAIIVLIYELIDENIIKVRYQNDEVFLKLNDITLEEINKLDIDKRELIKILFKGTNDKQEYILSDFLDKCKNDTIISKTINEIITNIKMKIDIKYTEGIMDKFEEYTKSKLLYLLVNVITVVPLVLLFFMVFGSLLSLKPYSILLFTLSMVLVAILILTNKKIYIKKEYIEEYNKLNGLKKFLLDFSNIKDHEIKYVELYDEYYLYALSLGITNKVEKDYKINSYLIDNINSNLKYLTYKK